MSNLQLSSIRRLRQELMTDCAVVIVTYHPNSIFANSLEELATSCSQVIVVDNTPVAFPLHVPQGVRLVSFGRNQGLATALNRGVELAGQMGFDNIFLLDQDSRPPENFFEKMLAFKKKVDSVTTDIALYVPDFYDRNSNSHARYPVLTPLTVRHVTCKDLTSGPRSHATIAITSGSLLPYSKYNRIGPFRDDYFIDFIDNEYCLRTYTLGFRIAVNCALVLDHAIGSRATHKFLGITVKPNHHRPVRRYYIARNGVRTCLEYIRAYPSFLPLLTARFIHEGLSILLYEREKTKKLKAMLTGIHHGLTGKMGPCLIPDLL